MFTIANELIQTRRELREVKEQLRIVNKFRSILLKFIFCFSSVTTGLHSTSVRNINHSCAYHQSICSI